MYEMDIGVQAEFKIHDSAHGDHIVIADTVPPQTQLPVVSVGQVSGRKTGKIRSINQKFTIRGASFAGIMVIKFDRSLWEGDSGSPV